ncbi:MAG: hypothetical protein HC855_12145, partial [Rhizobiales bacterium]|nr:hypothetical protein [Hyphomicrobiales bacterium]
MGLPALRSDIAGSRCHCTTAFDAFAAGGRWHSAAYHPDDCRGASAAGGGPGKLGSSRLSAKPGQNVGIENLTAFLAANGYIRSSAVVERGEFAVRGGILDVFPPGLEAPVRLDFFGDTIESIRSFDPESQTLHIGARHSSPQRRERSA